MKEILEELLKVLSYDPVTGNFTWSVRPRNHILGNALAGGKNAKGYWKIKFKNKTYSAHRLAFLFMTGKFPDQEVDHINNIPDDNRWCNLRLADDNGNMANRKTPKHNTSGVKGVTWDKKLNKWRARVMHDNKSYSVGFFYSLEEAENAVKSARDFYHGEFANHG